MGAQGAVSAAYAALVGEGALTDDPAQMEAAVLLDRIAGELEALETGRRGLAGLFRHKRQHIMGAYIHGEVGRGKTLLMDLFFDQVKVAAKRRVHFHEFMDEVHAAIAAFRAGVKDRPGDHDPIPAVVKPIIRDVRLLCFDEFHVTDITNAMLLQRLFEKLFQAGLVVVATSNVAPDDLYRDGLNRQLFVPFIGLLKSHVSVHELLAATDYRRQKFSGQPVYAFGAPAMTRAAMDQWWQRLAGGQAGQRETIGFLGRDIVVPRAAMGVARFDFADLCETPLGARDFLRVANQFHTLIIDDVPRLSAARTDAAKRFILLVDTLYDRGVKLCAGFAAPLDALADDKRTAFEFQRCQSRLIEMQSDAYLAAPRRGVPEGTKAQAKSRD